LRVLFDSSSLIASIIETHPKHEFGLSWLIRAQNKEFETIVSAHSLLEVYSVLTTAPFKPTISANLAKRLIDHNIKRIAKIESLTPNEYISLIDSLSSRDLKGGVVYDALIFECAKKHKVDKIITLNPKDFMRIDENNSIEIISN
jgi:predicted nucleic acid-binding protein